MMKQASFGVFQSFVLLCRSDCEKRQKSSLVLDTLTQTLYTRAIESKGADGRDSASAFLFSGAYFALLRR